LICFVDSRLRSTVAGAVAAVALAAAGCGGGIQSGGQATELVNPFLGPAYSQWLVGPISRMATAEEMDAFLALQDDAAAVQFIEDFWVRHNPAPARPDNPLRTTFEQRAAEADRRYTEGGYPGRRTDRGITYVLFGEPEKTDYEISPHPSDPPIEAWFYPAGAEAGLSGERPAQKYRFIKRGELTSFYVPRSIDDPRGRTPSIDRF
jgi:GWxTD domain-containing protein